MNWRKPVIRALLSLSGSTVVSQYDEALKLEFASREKWQKIADQRLLVLLRYAHQHTPYYKRVLTEAGVVSESGDVHLENFFRIPFLTKEIIRSEGSNLHTDELNTRKHFRNTSGGSTGVPVEFLQDTHHWDAGIADKMFFMHMNGKEPGDLEVKLWGSERDIFEGGESWKQRAKFWIYNRIQLNSFRMSEDQIREYIEVLSRRKPQLVWAYVDSMYELARFVLEKNLQPFNPPSLVLTAGTVDLGKREKIQQAFPKSSIINQYGSREVGNVATECPKHEGLHVFEHGVRVELIDSNGNPTPDGELGEIVVTNLKSLSMPLIRYRIGDTAIASSEYCSCGRNTRLLKSVTGRVTDHFKNAKGELIHGEYFTHLFYEREWIKKFQVIQEAENHVHVQLVKRGEEHAQDIQDITSKIQLVMGNACDVTFEDVDQIPETDSGKYRYTISKLS